MIPHTRKSAGDRQRHFVTEILAERARQDREWGAERRHDPFVWLAILGEEVGEVNEAALEMRFQAKTAGHRREWLLQMEQELIQTAAVALAALESIGMQAEEIGRTLTGLDKGGGPVNWCDTFICPSCDSPAWFTKVDRTEAECKCSVYTGSQIPIEGGAVEWEKTNKDTRQEG